MLLPGCLALRGVLLVVRAADDDAADHFEGQNKVLNCVVSGCLRRGMQPALVGPCILCACCNSSAEPPPEQQRALVTGCALRSSCVCAPNR